MHRADPSPRWRDRRYTPPGGDPPSQLLQPPAPLLPRRAQVTIRPLPPRRRLLGGYRISGIGVIAVLLWIVILVTIFWPSPPH